MPLNNLQRASRQVFNVRDYGVINNGTSSDQPAIDAALADAKAAKGVLYFPASPNAYRGRVVIDGSSSVFSGLQVLGDGPRSSKLTGLTTDATIDIFSTGFSGDVNAITASGLHVTAGGGATNAVRVFNSITFVLDDMQVNGTTSILGSQGIIKNVWGYGSPGLDLGTSNAAITGTGHLPIIGGQFTSSGAPYGPAVRITGNVTATFMETMFTCVGGITTVLMDGLSTGADYGNVRFIGCHTESVWDATNLGEDFLVGNTYAFGHLSIIGGMYFGHGNGTNYRRDCIHLVRARSVTVDGVYASKQAATNGYSRAFIRHETTFPAAGDVYSYRGNRLNTISGTMYSDASGLLVDATAHDYYPNRPTLQTPSFLNSWVNYGSGLSEAKYYRDHQGIVRCVGNVKDGTVGAGGLIFTLPEGYRPANNTYHALANGVAGTLVIASVLGTGDVYIKTGSNSHVALDGLAFLAVT